MTVELCKSNSKGDRFVEPSVIETWETDDADAARLVSETRPNGFFVRIQAEDKTGV